MLVAEIDQNGAEVFTRAAIAELEESNSLLVAPLRPLGTGSLAQTPEISSAKTSKRRISISVPS